LGTDFNISFVTVPIEALVHPLCVIPDCSGHRDIYFVVYLNITGANSLGNELSSLIIFRYWACVIENINIRGHQNDHSDHHREQKYTGATNNTINLINLNQFIVTHRNNK
jgi:hypothetical protein